MKLCVTRLPNFTVEEKKRVKTGEILVLVAFFDCSFKFMGSFLLAIVIEYA